MAAVINRVRKAFYMDSVALMRISTSVSSLAGVQTAALMIGSSANKKLMRNAGLLNADSDLAGPNDLIIAVRAENVAAANEGIDKAVALLDAPAANRGPADEWNPKTLESALQRLPDANLALISVPGEFAAAEGFRALKNGLNVMMFSDNVSVADELALKQEAQRRGLLMMGPDCGTAIIGGVPLAFANVVPRGGVGIVAASGTGLQEVASLLARNGVGISHAIGVGGRDLKREIGGLTTLMAIGLLDRDRDTRHIVIISKPPDPSVATVILDRVGKSQKPFSICFIGVENIKVPTNARIFADLRSTAENAASGKKIKWDSARPDLFDLKGCIAPGRHRVEGLFSGGTLCAEAQVFFLRAGLPVTSNEPVPGVDNSSGASDHSNVMLDLGADAYTLGRPHPMIDPTLRNQMITKALDNERTAVVLFDVVIGYGANADPSAELTSYLPPLASRKALLVASICGTEGDPQSYSRQLQLLKEAGIVVAPSNAHAAELAISVVGNKGG
jgi:FdrA protein